MYMLKNVFSVAFSANTQYRLRAFTCTVLGLDTLCTLQIFCGTAITCNVSEQGTQAHTQAHTSPVQVLSGALTLVTPEKAVWRRRRQTAAGCRPLLGVVEDK